jgi:tetratricopeptide (TPR) repeat protein
MSLLETVYNLFGGKRRAYDTEASQSNRPQCPRESEIINYCEGDLSPRERANLEQHLSNCDDCRETVILYSQEASGEHDRQESIPSLSDDLIKEQAARVLAYAAQDEFNQSQARERSRAARYAFGLSRMYRLAGAAMVVLVAAIIGVVIITKDSATSDLGMQAMTAGMKNGRNGDWHVSGFSWAPKAYEKRDGGGDRNSEESQRNFEIAWNQLRHAENEDAPAGERHNLARLYLSRGIHSEAEKARVILEHLIAKGYDSHEILNDLGTAYALLKKYDEAIDAFSKALAEKPEFSKALANRALARHRAGDRVSARQDWELLIEVSEDEDEKNEAREYLEKYPLSGSLRPAA